MTDFPTAAEFRAWLEALPPRKVIARSWGTCECPLALCLRQSVPDARVCRATWQPREYLEENAPLPKFAAAFVATLDERNDGRGITPRGCLAILRRVAPEAF